ncbi:MAG TPA: glycoside hydrolase family 2 TIM barrel-domain containing protein [Solirubrobacteraceae bacterium]|nr:glycoside hydrolase family 2 TIM barrel-domain containing protein [Solirubrobacteraceae bacterium]
MRRRLIPLATVLALGPGAAPASAEVRGSVPLNEGWEFADQAEGPWRAIRLPHVMDPEPSSEVWGGRVAWYRLRFQGPRTGEGDAWALRFEQVRRRAQVFLNGREIGTNADPYTPFVLPATGVQPGRENVLVLRVDNRRTPGWREGWWNWGGITRSVSLVPRGRVELRDTGLLSEVDCTGTCRAQVRLDSWLTNRTGEPVRPHVTVRLRPPDGGRLVTKTVRVRTVPPGETARVQFGVPVPKPQLWAPERPVLYPATVVARLGDRVEHAEDTRVGLRTVGVRDGHLELNGRRLDLRGASIQEDVAGRGPAMTDQDVEQIVADLEALNANVTRAHYLLDERLLDRLDEEGILVWSQAPVYHRDMQLMTRAGRSFELGSVRRTVLAARNHPSVITHSVANELSPRPDELRTTAIFLDTAREVTEDLDHTLPASVDILAWPGFEKQETYDRFDLLGLNSYFGWYQGDENHETGNLDDLEPFLRQSREYYERQALVMTEFGAEATMEGPEHVKETYAFQSRYVDHNLALIRRLGFMSGAIYWTLREFAVKPDWDGGAERVDVVRDSIHNKGLLTYETGERKPAWDVARNHFTSTPLYRSAPSRAVAAATGTGPRADGGLGSGALTGGVIGLLLTLAGLMVWFLRDIWRFGGEPEPAPAYVAGDPDRERHLELVA